MVASEFRKCRNRCAAKMRWSAWGYSGAPNASSKKLLSHTIHSVSDGLATICGLSNCTVRATEVGDPTSIQMRMTMKTNPTTSRTP